MPMVPAKTVDVIEVLKFFCSVVLLQYYGPGKSTATQLLIKIILRSHEREIVESLNQQKRPSLFPQNRSGKLRVALPGMASYEEHLLKGNIGDIGPF